jgi:hypothetical protein
LPVRSQLFEVYRRWRKALQMPDRRKLWCGVAALTLVTGAVLAPESAQASVSSISLAGPVFGMAGAPDGSLLVADAGVGIVEVRKGSSKLVVPLPGVSDVDPIGNGAMYAITGAGEDNNMAGKLFRASRGAGATQIADLSGFEAAVNPDGGEIDSNPFDVETLGGGKALVADAGGNDLLVVDRQGRIDWIATLPDELVSTAHAKTLAGCPNPPADLAFVCDLPGMIPGQGVATSVAVGPDGAYYVGELKGFPAEPGTSRVWRIEPGARHAHCGTSPACRVVADGFTSIVDLTFGTNGKMYVVEMDEASFLAVETGQGALGGTVNACNVHTWTCSAIATGLPMPIAAAVGNKDKVYGLINALVPGQATVIELS